MRTPYFGPSDLDTDLAAIQHGRPEHEHFCDVCENAVVSDAGGRCATCESVARHRAYKLVLRAYADCTHEAARTVLAGVVHDMGARRFDALRGLPSDVANAAIRAWTADDEAQYAEELAAAVKAAVSL